MREPDDKRGTAGADARVEAVVLRLALDLHPAQVSIAEVVRELADDPEDFAQRDAVERAARDLARTGLLHRNGEFVFPTRAALRFDRAARLLTRLPSQVPERSQGRPEAALTGAWKRTEERRPVGTSSGLPSSAGARVGFRRANCTAPSGPAPPESH